MLANIRLTEDDTTSSSRIFIKILFQDLSENMGLLSLNMRLQEPTLQMYFEGIFPKVLEFFFCLQDLSISDPSLSLITTFLVMLMPLG